MKRSRIARVSGSSRLAAAIERLDESESSVDLQVESRRRQTNYALLDARVPSNASTAQVDITNMYP